MPTLADGIAVKRPGVITRPLVERWVDEVVTVAEDAIADAMVTLMERAKLYVEGAGAVGVAALQSGACTPADTGVTCVVLSGGNVDLGVVPGLIRRHETTAGRRLVIFARIDDRPGGLVRFLTAFAGAGANLSRCSTSAKASTSACARPGCTRRSRSVAPSTPPAWWRPPARPASATSSSRARASEPEA